MIVEILLEQILGEKVIFPSGYEFDTVVESVGEEFNDPLQTGSLLLKSTNDQRRLTSHIKINEWRSPTSEYYRAHPTFLDFLQKIFSAVHASKAQVHVRSAYKRESEVPSNSEKWQHRYARTGSGVELMITPAPTRSFEEALEIMLNATLREGLLHFSAMGRDLGIVLMKDSIFLFMTGQKEVSRPVYEIDGSAFFTSSRAFAEWVDDVMDDLLETNVVRNIPDCSKIVPLNPGESYALTSGSVSKGRGSIDDVVGSLDVVVSRENVKDFLRLIQYPGKNIAFVNSYTDSNKPSWCGQENIPCPEVDVCHRGITGNGASVRCASRTMTPRLMRSILTLQYLVRRTDDTMNSRLKVFLAWTEPHSQDSLGGAERSDSLHFEGRQAVIALEKGYSLSSMAALSRLAICSGLDYVYHGDSNLTVAVMKQEYFDTQLVPLSEDGSVSLLPVSVPERDEYNYRMSSFFTENEMKSYPLFDSQISGTRVLFGDITAAHFRSKESQFRYFRLSRVLVKCYAAMTRHLDEMNKLYKTGKMPKLEIVRAFLSSAEERSLFERVLDRRLYTHSLGIALHLRLPPPIEDKFNNIWSLLEIAVEVCSPIFEREVEQSINLGVYRDGLFITYQPTFQMWFECEQCPELQPIDGTSQKEVEMKISTLATLSIQGRIIRGTNPIQACLVDYPPRPQSDSFVYLPDPKRSTIDSCNEGNTPFCQHTLPHRRQAVEEIWSYFQRKVYGISQSALRASLEGCLLTCSPCMQGPLWEEKLKHCDNMLHWMPFNTLNRKEYEVTTNLFPRGDEEAREYACYGTDRHCIDASPMVAILHDVIDRTIHWDNSKTIMKKLYGPTDNPLPILQLAAKIYALTAYGEVNLWIRQAEDIDTMRESLKVLFVYNSNVTSVHLYLLDSTTKLSIVTVLENYFSQWINDGCPLSSRRYLTPYVLHDNPKEFRSPEDTAAMKRKRRSIDDNPNETNDQEEESLVPLSQFRHVVMDHIIELENFGFF